MKTTYRNKSRAIYFHFGLMMLIFLLTLPVRAQFTTAQLGGTVVDPSGLALAGATVRAEQVGTAYTQTTTSGSSGTYLFPSLPVGNYQVTVTFTGFNTYTQKGITLATGQAVTLPIQLTVGSVAQNITVVANASMVTTDSAAVGQLIGQKDIVGLPLNGRYAQQLVFLVPGAENTTPNYCAANCEGGVFPSEQFAKVNGGSVNGVSYQLDGADYNDLYINANLPFPNPDAIQEFNFMADNMSAVYGDAIGGVVNVTLKSGTNSVHGDVFEFFRNSMFNAKNYFARSVSPYNQNQFGGDIGGPILKNRLFYFGTYQGTRFSSTNNGRGAFVPNAAERAGDFSALLPGSPVCAPYKTCVQLVNPVTGAPYLNNQIPVSPIATFILKGIPLPNGAALGLPARPGYPNDTFSYNGLPTVQNTNEYLVKLDLNAGKHHLSGHYFQLGYTQPLVVPTTNYLQMTGGAETLIDRSVSVIDLYTITPHFLLGSYYGYAKIDGHTYASSPFSMAEAGVKMAVPPNKGGGNTASLNFGVSGAWGLGSGNYGVWNRGEQSLREIATLTKGKNLIQFGGEVAPAAQPMTNLFQMGGTFSFSSARTGYNMADFEVGALSRFIQGGGRALDFTGINWSAFVQDDWKATTRLTVSAGLRWDPFIPYKDSLGRVACFEPGAPQSVRYPKAPPNLIFGGKNHDPGCPDAAIFANYANFGPRFGFAYRMTADGKRSLRGGVGYYYQPTILLINQAMTGVPPFAPIVRLKNVSLADPYGSAGLSSPFPEGFAPRNPGPDATFPAGFISLRMQDPRLRLPMVLSYNLTLEQGFGRNWLFRTAYLGNEGRRLTGLGDQGAGMLQLNPAIYVPGHSSEANTQQRRVYPNYSSITVANSGVNSNYNALQLTVEKRFADGFSLLSSFVWAKAMDDFAPLNGSNLYSNSCTCGRHFDYGPSDDDLSKVFKINGNYETPRVHIQRVADKLLNGWELTAIANWQTGRPFTVFSDVDNSFSDLEEDRADLTVPNIRDAFLGHRPHPGVIGQWFNPAAFAPNAIGTFGNAGKNNLRGPGYFNTDLAAIKNTKFGERVSLQFRAEMFNATNHVNFGLPDNFQDSVGFGQISGTEASQAYGGSTSYGTSQPRIMQFGVKTSF